MYYKGDISYTFGSMYFKQPTDSGKVLAETFLEMADLKKCEGNRLCTTLKNGHQYKFTYQNGKCSAFAAKGDWGVNLKLVRIGEF